MRARCFSGSLIVVALAFASGPALADQPRSVLPRLASTVLPPPDAATTTELDQLLAKVASSKEADRNAALARLKDDGAALVPALARKLADLKKSANRDQIGTLITDMRKAGHKGSKKDDDGKKHEDKDDGGDWFAFAIASPKPNDPAYRDLIGVLTIERALVDVGTTPAVRVLLDTYLAFGDLFRVDLQHMVQKLGDKAVPALIEDRKHDVEKMRTWASKELDVLGKAIPGEAVQIVDLTVLADVLRAFGRTKEIDALRVVVSFTGSDRVQVRDAAREAVVSYGDAALWMLREEYERFTGQRPQPGATWDKIASDIFTAHDQARVAEVVSMFEDGLAKQKDGKDDEAVALFDKVLARVPTFDRRGEMAPSYLAVAHKLDSKDPAEALLYARKALRLDPDGAGAKALQSYALTLEGEDLVLHGLADTVPFRRALELDASNTRAKTDLARLETQSETRAHPAYRYLVAAAIGFLSMIAALFVGAFRRHKTDGMPPPTAPEAPAQ